MITTTAKAVKLRCRFCLDDELFFDKEALTLSKRLMYRVACPNCEALGPVGYSEAEAVEYFLADGLNPDPVNVSGAFIRMLPEQEEPEQEEPEQDDDPIRLAVTWFIDSDVSLVNHSGSWVAIVGEMPKAGPEKSELACNLSLVMDFFAGEHVGEFRICEKGGLLEKEINGHA